MTVPGCSVIGGRSIGRDESGGGASRNASRLAGAAGAAPRLAGAVRRRHRRHRRDTRSRVGGDRSPAREKDVCFVCVCRSRSGLRRSAAIDTMRNLRPNRPSGPAEFPKRLRVGRAESLVRFSALRAARPARKSNSDWQLSAKCQGLGRLVESSVRRNIGASRDRLLAGPTVASRSSASSSANRSRRASMADGSRCIQRHAVRRPPPCLRLRFAAGVIDQNPPHRLGGGGKEVAAAVPMLGLLARRPAEDTPRGPAPSPAASAPASRGPVLPRPASAARRRPAARAARRQSGRRIRFEIRSA